MRTPKRTTAPTKRQREARALARVLRAINREEKTIARLAVKYASLDHRPPILVMLEIEAAEFARLRRRARR